MSTEYNGIDHNLSIDKTHKFFDHFHFCDCWDCQRYGVPILNEVYIKGQLEYWFEIPKNASTSIKNYKEFYRACVKESYHPGKLYHELDDTIVPIVVYNDPIKRFISLCNDYFSPHHCNKHSEIGHILLYKSGAIKKEDSVNVLSPEEKLKSIFSIFHKIKSKCSVHHFYPQTFFIDTDKFKNFELVPISEVNKRFDIEGNYWNVSSKHMKVEHLSNEQIEFLKDLYSDDYQFISKHK